MGTGIDAAELVSKSTHLPTMPAVAKELLEIAEWEDIDLRNVAGIIEKDVSLASKVLRVVNSPFYGFARKVTTISQALVILGLRATRSLALSFSILHTARRDRTDTFDYAAFWTRSLNTATAARELARVSGFHTEEEAFLSGLLQNIGVMVLATCASDLYAPVIAQSEDGLIPSPELERSILGTDHVAVAGMLFEHWNMPLMLAVPVFHHHKPDDPPEGTDAHMALAIHIQYLAGRLGDMLYAPEVDAQSLSAISDYASDYLDISSDNLDALLHRVDLRMRENAALFDISAERPDTYANLLQKANLALGDIAREQESVVKEIEAAKAEAQMLSEQLRIANNKLLEQALRDPLTDLANRRAFLEMLETEIERSKRFGKPLALLFIDLDNFKSVNDRFGHLEGDMVLKHTAGVLKQQTRTSDIVSRYGGEEFIAALISTDVDGAAIVGERIRAAVEGSPVSINRGRTQVQITASVGAVAWDPKTGPASSEELIQKADHAMYKAKEAGRNCVCQGDA